MINNYGDCAAASESGRQPWIVHGVDVYDEQNFIVNFNATLSDWEDVMSGAVIEFGAMPSTSTKRDDTFSKTLDLSLAHSLPQNFFSKTTNSGLDFSIDCPGCATTGTISIVGQIVMNSVLGVPTSVKSISISATPKGVGANLALGFGVSGTLGSGWSKDWNLVTVGLPGWSIPKIVDLGPEVSIDAGFTLSGIDGTAEISAGINVAIPDSSSAVLGIDGVDSSFNGWIPTVTPQTPTVSVEVDGHLELFTEIGLDVGLTVLGKYGFGGGFFLRIPDVNIDLGAEFNTQGACPGSADVFGVTLGCTVGVNLGLGVYTESGGDKDWKANKTMYENDSLITPISKCFPLGPTLPASIKDVSIKTVGTVPVSTSTAASTSVKTTSVAVSSSKASTTPVSTTSKTSASASATTIKVSSTGVTSSKPTSTGVSSVKGTGASSSALGYGTAPISSTTSKLSGTGVSSSAKTSGTVVISSSLYISASGVSSVKTAIASSGTSVLGLETSKSSSATTAKPTTTVGSPVYVGSSSSSALGLETSKASSTAAASTTKASITVVASSTSTQASSTGTPTKTATGTVAPAPTATGTISTCDKWVTIEDTTCSCTNIENYYGVSAANLATWNPALGSECKLTVGQAVCIGVQGSYKRAVNGRLARFVDA